MRARHRQFLAYLAAPVLVGLAMALRHALLGAHHEPEAELLLLAVALAGMLGGLGPAILATLLGLLGEVYFYSAPVGSFVVANRRNGVELGLLLVAGVAIGVTFEVLRRARLREAAVRRTLAMITHCNEAILRAGTEEELYGDICRIIVEDGGYRMCWVGLAEHDGRKSVRPVAHAGHEDGYLRDIDIVWADEPRGRGPTGTALRERRIVVGRDFATDPATGPWKVDALRRGYQSATSIPVVHDGQVLAAIVMYSNVVAAFSRDELRFLKRLSSDVAFGVNSIRQRVARERQEAELATKDRALRASEERFQAYVKAAPLGIFVVDGRGRYQDFNPAALELIGVDGSELRSMNISDLVDEADRPAAIAQFGELVTAGRMDADYRLRRRDGSHVWVALRGVKIADDRYMAFCKDISARKDAERRLQERERYLESILTNALDGFWVVDREGHVLDVNPAYCSMSGYERDELLRMRISNLEAMESPDVTARRIQRIREQGFDTFETLHRRKDGGIIRVSARVSLLSPDSGLMVCFFQDITERHDSVEALRTSEKRYRTLVAGMASGLVLQLADGTIVDCNPAAERLLGLSADELKGRKSVDPRWRALREDGSPYPGDEHPPMMALKTGRTQVDVIMAVHKPDGEVSWLSVNAEPLRDGSGKVHAVLSTFVDITRRRRAEAERSKLQAQLAHSARLTAMGTLVAGVAHEINNPLSALTSNAGTALEDVREFQRTLRGGAELDRERLVSRSNEVLEMLVDVSTSAERIARIVKDLTILGRPDQPRERVRLADVVSGAVKWLPATVTCRASIRTELEEVPDVIASASQIEQVLINLVTNAALSFPEGRPGDVVVRLAPGAPGRVRMDVADDGPGIARELLERIFEPFFTTRPLGKGTGLGLSICSAIVSAHEGLLTVESEPGKGSTFRVELPAAPAEVP